MATFAELQKKLTTLNFRKIVYQHLIDHLEGEFRSNGGMPAKKVLLSDVKQAVPDESFSEVVAELFGGLTNVTNEINSISSTDVPPAPVVAPVVAPVPAPAPVVAPVPSKKSKSTTQGEVPS